MTQLRPVAFQDLQFKLITPNGGSFTVDFDDLPQGVKDAVEASKNVGHDLQELATLFANLAGLRATVEERHWVTAYPPPS